MILRDSITVRNVITPSPDRTLPAHVGWDRSDGFMQASGSDGQWASRAVLTAVIPPTEDIDRTVHQVLWRGDLYRINAEPMTAMRNGTPHHMTLLLYRASG